MVRAEGRRRGVPSVVQLLSYECGLCQPPSPVMERDPHPLWSCALCVALQEPGCNSNVQRLPLGFGRMSKFFPLPPSFLGLQHSPAACSLLPSTLHSPHSLPPTPTASSPPACTSPPPFTWAASSSPPPCTFHPPPQLQSPPLHPASPSLLHPSHSLLFSSLQSPHFPTPTAAPPPAYTPPSRLQSPPLQSAAFSPACRLLPF